MPNAARPSFLRHFARGATVRRGPDLGDMGTAFALDQTLDEMHYETQTGAASAPPQAAPVSPWRVWLGRKLGA